MSDVYKGATPHDHIGMGEEFVQHHSVMGMKWGVRRYKPYSQVPRKSGKNGKETGEAKKWRRGRADGQKRRYSYAKKGGTIEKGSKMLRLTTEEKDPTYGEKKHVSITKSDNAKWNMYLTPAYIKSGKSVYQKELIAKADIKVASDKEVGKIFYENFIQNKNASISMKAVMNSADLVNSIPSYRHTYDGTHINEKTASLDASLNVAYQTETGKAFVEELWKQGYGAMSDRHGRNTAKDPLIVIKPDKQLSEANSKKISRR